MSDEVESHPRKCQNWLIDFLKWTIPRSEAKESYIFWTGLFTLSCVLRRHVKVSKEYLGSWECYPYLYLLFLGPPGNKKTTTVNYNLELLNEIPGIVSAPDQITVPKLASTLIEADECSMYINAGELQEFIIKSGSDMFSFLTKAFDGAKKISVGTHMRDIELAENPCINFLGASTLETLTSILPQSSLDGGFGRRCIFIYEEDVRTRKLIYRDINIKGIYNDYYSNLIHDLKFIASNLFGDFRFTEEAEIKFEQWYIEGAGINKTKGTNNFFQRKMKGYYESKPAFVMKIAMLLKIADRDTISKDQLVLDWKTIEDAIITIESLESNMGRVLSNTGKNIFKNEIKDIYNFIKENGPILMSIVLREFSAVAETTKLIELIQGLSSANLIILEPEGSDIKLRIK